MAEAYPLAWPPGWPRTEPDKQGYGDQFMTRGAEGRRERVTFARGRDRLYEELGRLKATGIVISSNHRPDARGIPIERARVNDHGVAVYFKRHNRHLVMACDRFASAAANMRSLGLAIEAMRTLERHGGGHMLEKAFTGFEALPAPGQATSRHWTRVLGVSELATRAEIDAAYRALARQHHPDAGGNPATMAELNQARVEALQFR